MSTVSEAGSRSGSSSTVSALTEKDQSALIASLDPRTKKCCFSTGQINDLGHEGLTSLTYNLGLVHSTTCNSGNKM